MTTRNDIQAGERTQGNETLSERIIQSWFAEPWAALWNGRGSGRPASDLVCLADAAPELRSALLSTNCDTNHDGVFCNCTLADGTRPDADHATACVNARTAIAKAEGKS